MIWYIQYLPEAITDLERLDGSQRILIRKAIKKVSKNPLPDDEGGYGHPLSNKRNLKLAGFLKIKLKAAGLRVVYKLERIDGQMLIIVIGVRTDEQVYEVASKRINEYRI